MAKKDKKEGAVAKGLRTWSPGKYIGKFLKGESIGVSEKTAKQRAKKAAEKKASRKASTAKKTKAHKESVAKKDKGTGAKDWYPGKYAKKLIKGEPVGVPKSKQKAAPKKVKKAAPQKFGKAFSSARKAGKKTFTWKGKSYSTKTADDVKKEKAAKASKPDVRKIVKNIAKNEADKKWKSGEKKGDEGLAQLKKEGVMAEGGRVESSSSGESNPFGWPSRDARNGGKG